MAETKAAFRRRLARLIRILRTGTTSGTGDFDTVVCLPLIDHYPVDDALTGSSLYDVTGSEWRRVSDWVASTGTATVQRAFTATQASGRAIEIYEQFSPDDLDDALRMALDEVYPYIATEVVDQTLTVIADQHDYNMPAAIRDVERMLGGKVEWEHDEPHSLYAEFQGWTYRTSSGSRTIMLPNIAGTVGRNIRVTGLGVLTFPSTDATSISLDSDTLQLLAYKAAEIVWRTGPGLTGRDAEFADAQSKRFAELYEMKKDAWGVIVRPSKLRGPADVAIIDAPLAYNNADPS
jgi:hypothetical protein